MLIQLNNTQLYMKEARAALTDAKETLGNKRADLLQMWSRRQTLEEMTRILDQMCVSMGFVAIKWFLIPFQRTSQVRSGCSRKSNIRKTFAAGGHSTRS